jgi:hypothetical protein
MSITKETLTIIIITETYRKSSHHWEFSSFRLRRWEHHNTDCCGLEKQFWEDLTLTTLTTLSSAHLHLFLEDQRRKVV